MTDARQRQSQARYFSYATYVPAMLPPTHTDNVAYQCCQRRLYNLQP
jgi:hypothetical protein